MAGINWGGDPNDIPWQAHIFFPSFFRGYKVITHIFLGIKTCIVFWGPLGPGVPIQQALQEVGSFEVAMYGAHRDLNRDLARVFGFLVGAET